MYLDETDFFWCFEQCKAEDGILEWVQQSMTFTLSNLHFTKNQILQKKS